MAGKKADVDVVEFNRHAWNHQVKSGNRWTVPVGPEEIAKARNGQVEIVLTPTRVVPREWYPPLKDCRLLGLAAGGGQQGPILAAAGAKVTTFDNSPEQLARDKEVAEREGLDIRCVQGDMADLSALEDGEFDCIINPVSTVFVENLSPVWAECFRVLAPGGCLLAGFTNPLLYLFDEAPAPDGTYTTKHRVPYSDLESLSAAKIDERRHAGEPIEFSHSLDEIIGGLTRAGFVISAYFDDDWGGDPIDKWFDAFFALKAVKPTV